jgi:hypothetical protein
MVAIALGVVVVFVLGAVYVIRQTTGGGSRPVGAFRRSASDVAPPLLMSDASYASTDDDRDRGDSSASDDGRADSSDAGGDSGGGDGGAGGDGSNGSE